MTLSFRVEVSPIILDFKDIHDTTNRKLIQELIKKWKHKIIQISVLLADSLAQYITLVSIL
jgi:hypothetical protein